MVPLSRAIKGARDSSVGGLLLRVTGVQQHPRKIDEKKAILALVFDEVGVGAVEKILE